MNRTIEVFATATELVRATAEKIVEILGRAVADRGRADWALAGGNTPRAVYALLAADEFRARVDWRAVHFFWGDERAVPPDHPESNFGMARDTLLARISVPDANIHRMRGEIEPEAAAEEYAAVLAAEFPQQPPRFDLIMLGLGEDGHTASLFPGTPVLAELAKTTAAVFVPRLVTWRITLTLPVLAAAQTVIFLVSGAAKANIVEKVVTASSGNKKLPATLVQPRHGTVMWLLDAEAADRVK